MDNYNSLSDADLLKTLADVREANGRINMEIERRFQERDTDTIETDAHVATRRTDTTKYVFGEHEMNRYNETGEQEWIDKARVLGRPYVSLKTKQKDEAPL
jgi:hypothetical protein